MPKKLPHDQAQFRVGDAMVHPERLVISINDEEHPIEPRIMEVLIALASAAQNNEVLSAVNLYIRAWIGGAHAEGNAPDPRVDVMQAENPVHKAITHLRKVFGDDPKSPRYIETIRKRGYRLVARVVYQDHYRRVAVARKIWNTGSPYVGLNAFDSRHASVFLGRSRATGELIESVRRQIDQQRRLVLVVGASGCGKTSLVNAGVIPILTEKGGYDGLHALSVARCDLAGTRREDALPRLAAALMQWSMDRREVFPPQPVETLAETLRRQPESLPAKLDDSFQRHASRDMSAFTHPHLLLVIDHAEAIVADPSFSGDDHAEIDLLLHHLCESRHVCVIIIVRGDFYLALAEALPGMTERKSGDGHVDVLTPRTGEIGDIIRIPAASAGLEFQQHPESKDYLDDVLLRAAVAQPDALPLLQHTLQMLYERRNTSMQLCFDAYQEIGGLEGALAHHAEQVFKGLPGDIQTSLDKVLSRTVVMQPENDRVSARRVPRRALDDQAIALAEAFVQARLFVAEHENGNAHYRVAHEALLRQWPRIRDWTQDNRRILQARVRLQRAAVRWAEEGRRDDHLLNPGRPLEEALEVRKTLAPQLLPTELQLLVKSEKHYSKTRIVRLAAIALLITLSIASSGLSLIALSSKSEAEQQRKRAVDMAQFLVGDFADKFDQTGDLAMIERIGNKVFEYCKEHTNQGTSTEFLAVCARSLRKIGKVKMEKAEILSAREILTLSMKIAEAATSSSPHSIDAMKEYGQSASWLGKLESLNNKHEESLRLWIIYKKTCDKIISIDNSPSSIHEKSYALTNIGYALRALGRTSKSEEAFSEAIALKKQAISIAPRNTEWIYELAVVSSMLSGAQFNRGYIQSAHSGYREQELLIRQILDNNPQALDWERQLTSILQFQSQLNIARGTPKEAEPLIEEAIARLKTITKSQPDNGAWKRYLANAHLIAGDIARHIGEEKKSNDHFGSGIEIISSLPDATPAIRRLRSTLKIRQLLLFDGEFPQATLEREIRIIESELTLSPNDNGMRTVLSESLLLASKNQFDRGNHEQAMHYANKALDILRSTSNNEYDLEIAALIARAECLKARKRPYRFDRDSLPPDYRHPDYLNCKTPSHPS